MSEKLSKIKEKTKDKVEKIKSLFPLIITIFKVLIFIVANIASFLYGARFFEIGKSAESLGASLKGSTIKITGPCSIDGEPRDPALIEDEVKISAVDGKKISGVIRKTREFIECNLDDVSVDKFLISDLNQKPSVTPEITMHKEKKRDYTIVKMLTGKTIVLSGLCSSQESKKTKDLPPMKDEKLKVTLVELAKESDENFFVSGIRESDGLPVTCSSRAISYVIDDGKKVVEEKLTLIGKEIKLTSVCKPDPRGRVPTKIGESGKILKVTQYDLIDAIVKITEETIEPDKVMKLAGTIVNKKSPLFGYKFVCDPEKTGSAIVWSKYDPEQDSVDVFDEDKTKDAKPQENDVFESVEEAPKK